MTLFVNISEGREADIHPDDVGCKLAGLGQVTRPWGGGGDHVRGGGESHLPN